VSLGEEGGNEREEERKRKKRWGYPVEKVTGALLERESKKEEIRCTNKYISLSKTGCAEGTVKGNPGNELEKRNETRGQHYCQTKGMSGH